MRALPRIQLHNVTYSMANTWVNFGALNLSLGRKRYGIVGDNGTGKTTLMRLISGVIAPHQGSIQIMGAFIYIPQTYDFAENTTVADALGLSEKLNALSRIEQGSVLEKYFDVIADDWDIKARALGMLHYIEAFDIDLDTLFSNVSGGQRTKVLLAKAMLSKADFILLDEPTNNLDAHSKQKLYQWIKQLRKGLIIISHDRTLLDYMDEIIEITTKGVNHYGGNYTLYKEQKKAYQESITQDLLDAKQKIKKTELSVQATREKHEQRQKKGKALRKKGNTDKLTANSMKGRSEKTQAKNITQADIMHKTAKEALSLAQSKIEIKESIKASLPSTKIPQGKMLVNIEHINFSYRHQKTLFEDFSLNITGPERIALCGKNGSGKSTLIQLLLGKLTPQKGSVEIGAKDIYYLDQDASFLNPALSILDNLLKYNKRYSTQEAHEALAHFNFRNTQATKLVSHLSGGEKMRASLAISLMSDSPPQLIILDEPTNHIDITSIEAIESMLQAYKGAMIIISHDPMFLREINLSRYIDL